MAVLDGLQSVEVCEASREMRSEEAMSEVSGTAATDREFEALAEAWPRPLIAAGRAESLARWWCESRRAAIELGAAPFPRRPATPALWRALFEARRARQLCRGLEGAEEALAMQERGLRQAPAARVASGARRISRLLVVSEDGAARFYRQIEKLCSLHGARLEALVLECDEVELGRAIFGPGQLARAVLLDHKDAVVRFLEILEASLPDPQADDPDRLREPTSADP
jgi:hypothetical protein